MLTVNNILKEIKDIPVNRLEEAYQLVQSLTPTIKSSKQQQKKILSFGGSFKDLSAKDYKEYIDYTKNTRAKLFDRSVEI